MLGGGEDKSTHSIRVLDNTYSKKFNTHASNYKVILKNIDGKTYQEVCHNFEDIMKDVVQSVLKPAEPDVIKFHIKSTPRGFSIKGTQMEMTLYVFYIIMAIICH